MDDYPGNNFFSHDFHAAIFFILLVRTKQTFFHKSMEMDEKNFP